MVDGLCFWKDRWWFGGVIAVLAAGAAIFLVRLGDRSVISEEVRWAEVAREMRDSHNYFRPTINGRIYYDKPLGSYWLIVAASWLTGEVNETAARLPAALSALLGVGLVISLGRRLYGEREGLLAGAILGTSFGFAFFARRATADMETVTGVLGAVCLFERFHRRERKGWVATLWSWMACVSLTKGLLGFVLPLTVFFAFSARSALSRRDHSGLRQALNTEFKWLFNCWTLLAIPLAAFLYLMPFVISASDAEEGLRMVWRENIRRFFAPHNHAGTPYLYVGVAFVLAAPWSVFLPASLLNANSTTRGDRLAAAYFWAIFLFFTFAASRRSYYLLPVLPAVALLISRLLLADRNDVSSAVGWLRCAGWLVLGLAFVAIGLALLPPSWVLPAPHDALPPLPLRWLIALGWLFGLIVFTGLATRRLRLVPIGLGLVVVAVSLWHCYFFAIAYPAADELRTRRDFIQMVRATTADSLHPVAVYNASDVVFELGRIVPAYFGKTELVEAIRDKRVNWIVSSQRHWTSVEVPGIVIAKESAWPWENAERIANKLILVEVAP